MLEQDTSTYSTIAGDIQQHLPSVAGAFVSFVVGKDYSFYRFASGMASGLFVAYYFSPWLVSALPFPVAIPPDKQLGMAGAVLGLTGYVVVSTLMIFAQSYTGSLLGKLPGAPDKGGS